MLTQKKNANLPNTQRKGKWKRRILQGINRKAKCARKNLKSKLLQICLKMLFTPPKQCTQCFSCCCLLFGVVFFFFFLLTQFYSEIKIFQGRNCCFSSLPERVGSESCSSAGKGCLELELMEYHITRKKFSRIFFCIFLNKNRK